MLYCGRIVKLFTLCQNDEKNYLLTKNRRRLIMNNQFPTLLRQPDCVVGATEDSPFRYEEDVKADCPVDYEYQVSNTSAKVIVRPSGAPIKHLKLRFRADLSFIDAVLGDEWALAGAAGAYSPLTWSSILPNRKMPWFVYLRHGSRLACYGLKTGPNCFGFWQVDAHGLTLFLNLMAGSVGVDLKEELVACELVERIAPEGEDPYRSAQKFAAVMCDKPVLPKQPVFGVNNWYWAYGNITHQTVLDETDRLLEITAGTKHRPYMVIDDGWQINRALVNPNYNGGPWLSGQHYGNLEETAHAILEKGAKPGVWFRPLLTMGGMPWQACYRATAAGHTMDPSHPYTLERVYEDTARLRNWGFELIKHDFSTFDMVGDNMCSMNHGVRITHGNEKLYDQSKTMAMVIKDLYRAIQKGAGDAEVIGCNTVGHLAAGIHSIQRVGYDTSGTSFEYTACNGPNSMMRLPLNGNFFMIDADCAAFTKEVPFQPNLDFLKACAVTGTTTMAAIAPDILTPEQKKEVAKVFRIADKNQLHCGIENFEKTSSPEIFVDGDDRFEFEWTAYYEGSRSQLG
jgi:alpha-galactosidase